MNWGPYFVTFQCNSNVPRHGDRAAVIPLWPIQPWLTFMVNLLMDKPIILPQSNTLLAQRHNRDLYPPRHQLRLLAYKSFNREEFPRAIAVIPRSWSVGNQKKYEPYISKWHRFCVERQIPKNHF